MYKFEYLTDHTIPTEHLGQAEIAAQTLNLANEQHRANELKKLELEILYYQHYEYDGDDVDDDTNYLNMIRNV